MAPLHTFSPAFESIGRTKMKYSLDISGVAGFFGGKVALSAMGTVHIYRGRKWLGWYNSPGSYEIAQSYGVLCRSRVWDGLYPGVNVDPARLFHLDDKEGPPYRGVFSGTRMAATGHLACLLIDQCEELPPVTPANVHQRQSSQPCTVTVATLSHGPVEPTISSLTLHSSLTTYLSIFPISATIVTAVMCVLVANDWYSFGLIIYGAIASGVCCLVIGSGKLALQHPSPAPGVPPGDGILGAAKNDVVLLLGKEEAVNVITRGKFTLTFPGKPQYHLIGICAVLLTIQFLGQLLIIPLGTLFGQVMFLASLFVSWAYTSFLSSIDRYSLQRDIVQQNRILGKIDHKKYRFETRTAMTVYILLRLKSQSKLEITTSVLERALDEMLPNDTHDWKSWKIALVSHLISKRWDQDLTPASVEAQSKTLSQSKDLVESQSPDSIESQSEVPSQSKELIESQSNPLIEALCRSANDAIEFYKNEDENPSSN